MANDDIQPLWEFVSGDAEQTAFETWLYSTPDLEPLLGAELYLQLISCDFRNREERWQIRQRLRSFLATRRQCECPLLRRNEAVAMGGEINVQSTVGMGSTFTVSLPASVVVPG